MRDWLEFGAGLVAGLSVAVAFATMFYETRQQLIFTRAHLNQWKGALGHVKILSVAGRPEDAAALARAVEETLGR